MIASAPLSQVIASGVDGMYYVLPFTVLGGLWLWTWLRYRSRQEDAKMRPTSVPIRTEYTKERLFIPSLAEPDGVIRGVTFNDCVLVGPAVIVGAGGHASMYEPELVANSETSAFIEMPEGRSRPDGAVGFHNCILNRCRLHKVSFASTRDNIEEMKRTYGLNASQLGDDAAASFLTSVASPPSSSDQRPRPSPPQS